MQNSSCASSIQNDVRVWRFVAFMFGTLIECDSMFFQISLNVVIDAIWSQGSQNPKNWNYFVVYFKLTWRTHSTGRPKSEITVDMLLALPPRVFHWSNVRWSLSSVGNLSTLTMVSSQTIPTHKMGFILLKETGFISCSIILKGWVIFKRDRSQKLWNLFSNFI